MPIKWLANALTGPDFLATMKVVTAAQMSEIDRRAQTEFGISEDCLMTEAGRAVARVIRDRFSPQRVCVVCGKGNNAGDGYVVARELHLAKADVTVVAVVSPSELRGAASRAYASAVQAGVPIVGPDPLPDLLAQADVVVDALLGTGVKGPVRQEWEPVVLEISRAPGIVVAVDVPSGVRELHPGETLGTVISADLTVTIGCPKLALLTYPGSEHVGELIVERINFPAELLDSEALELNYEPPSRLGTWIPHRPAIGHKGTFGKVGIIAGSPPFAGAAILSTRAALRAGCGLAYLFTTAALNPVYKMAIPEAVTVIVSEDPKGYLTEEAHGEILRRTQELDALAIGPGLGTTVRQQRLVRELIRQSTIPMVVDADALTCLAEELPQLRESIVLTPHPGEMARLLGKTTAEVQAARIEAVRSLATRTGATVLLKGADSLIARPDGQVWISPGATSALAKGGTGDVLTGLIASLLAQGMAPWQAALLGAQVHLRAAIRCARAIGERGVLASEVADALPYGFLELEECALSTRDGDT